MPRYAEVFTSGYYTRGARDCYDVKVYLAPPESLRTEWKVKRDTRKRGYSNEQVLEQLRKREPDSEQFIRPQRQWSDIVVSFYPPSDNSQASDLLLNVRLVLRPTIPHPDWTPVLDPDKGHLSSAIRLELDRDMGKPVDVLEIDGHATKEQVRNWNGSSVTRFLTWENSVVCKVMEILVS